MCIYISLILTLSYLTRGGHQSCLEVSTKLQLGSTINNLKVKSKVPSIYFFTPLYFSFITSYIFLVIELNI